MFNEIMKKSDAVIEAIFSAYADGVDADGDAVIYDGETLDDVLEIIDIIARIDSRKYNAFKREYESVL